MCLLYHIKSLLLTFKYLLKGEFYEDENGKKNGYSIYVDYVNGNMYYDITDRRKGSSRYR